MTPYIDNCLFTVVPDVLYEPMETYRAYQKYYPTIKELGFKTAFVCQDGMENYAFPNDGEYDCVFIGGSTSWKMSRGAIQCIEFGLERNKHIHVGRVNSIIRMKHFAEHGVHTVDGTSITHSPDVMYDRLDRGLQIVNETKYSS